MEDDNEETVRIGSIVHKCDGVCHQPSHQIPLSRTDRNLDNKDVVNDLPTHIRIVTLSVENRRT